MIRKGFWKGQLPCALGYTIRNTLTVTQQVWRTCDELTILLLSLHQSMQRTLFPWPLRVLLVFMTNCPRASTRSATWCTGSTRPQSVPLPRTRFWAMCWHMEGTGLSLWPQLESPALYYCALWCSFKLIRGQRQHCHSLCVFKALRLQYMHVAGLLTRLPRVCKALCRLLLLKGHSSARQEQREVAIPT